MESVKIKKGNVRVRERNRRYINVKVMNKQGIYGYKYKMHRKTSWNAIEA